MVEEAAATKGGHGGVRTPRAIILEPARELAEQVSECLDSFKVRGVEAVLDGPSALRPTVQVFFSEEGSRVVTLSKDAKVRRLT